MLVKLNLEEMASLNRGGILTDVFNDNLSFKNYSDNQNIMKTRTFVILRFHYANK